MRVRVVACPWEEHRPRIGQTPRVPRLLAPVDWGGLWACLTGTRCALCSQSSDTDVCHRALQLRDVCRMFT